MFRDVYYRKKLKLIILRIITAAVFQLHRNK